MEQYKWRIFLLLVPQTRHTGRSLFNNTVAEVATAERVPQGNHFFNQWILNPRNHLTAAVLMAH